MGVLTPFKKHENEGRLCPVCFAQLAFFSDDYKAIYKCLRCGYSKKVPRNYEILLSFGSTKKGWYEIYQPIEEQLYNALLSAEWSPEEAANMVLEDLDLNKDEATYFLEKIKFLEGDKP